MHYKYLIIGGGIAGVTAAETIRERDHEGNIGICSEEPHLLYSRVLLPNYIKNVIPQDRLFLRTADDFEAKNIAFLLGKRVMFVDAEKREAKTAEGETYSFEKLLLASGGAPRTLGAPGEDKRGIFYLQTIEDADRIRDAAGNAKKAIIVGGGFIALEFLEVTRTQNIPTTLICRSPWMFGKALDAAGGALLEENLARNGVEFSFENSVTEFFGTDAVSGVMTRIGTAFRSDFVGIGAGIRRHDDFLLGTGISIVPGKGVRVNEFLETAVPGIFAAGDVAEYFDTTIGRSHTHGNWTNAFLQGKIAGENMVGNTRVPFRKAPSYSITNFGFRITCLGWTEEIEGVETLSRMDAREKMYARFFLEKGLLVGAVLINMPQKKALFARIIEEKISTPDIKSKLADINFPLENLVSAPHD